MLRGILFGWFIIELIVFFAVASMIGLLAAILLIILSMIIGSGIIRVKGMATFRKAQMKAATGEAPDAELQEGLTGIMAGMFLFVPGFLSSVIGLALLIPGWRQCVARWLIRHGFIQPRQQAPHQPNFQQGSDQQHTTKSSNGRTIEGEYHHDE